MIYFFVGTDRARARAALNAEVERRLKAGVRTVRITDAHSLEDLSAALPGSVGQTSMFVASDERILVLDNVLEREETRSAVLDALPALSASPTVAFILEERVPADIRRRIEKHAAEMKVFDNRPTRERSDIFALADALRRGDKKTLWVRYQEQLVKDAAPEAIHGVLFWGAKDMLLKSRDERLIERARRLIVELVELPHEARRRGEDMEYALERFVLSGM